MKKTEVHEKQVYMNRELSWLKFNERVLEEAESNNNPLCQRLSFTSIYQSNLDEFFMVRVGSLVDQMILDKNLRENKTEMTADSEIGRSANDVFTALASDTTVKESEKLLAAPNCLQNRVVEMIEEQIALAEKGEEAYIGVKIELAVRGICCLIPEVPDETENIRVENDNVRINSQELFYEKAYEQAK